MLETHFERLFNTEDPESEAVITPAEDILDIITEPPSVDEVKKAIAALKKGKAADIDQINAELLKAKEHLTPTILTHILHKIWTTEEIPIFWSTRLVVKLPTKGDFTNCNNWRGIMLLSVISKILSRVILNRVFSKTDPLLRKEQAGFRKGRSCADRIFTLMQIIY